MRGADARSSSLDVHFSDQLPCQDRPSLGSFTPVGTPGVRIALAGCSRILRSRDAPGTRSPAVPR